MNNVVYIIVKVIGDWYTYDQIEEHTAYRDEAIAMAIARHLEKRTGDKYRVLELTIE
jgi:hypothetical protein